MIRQLSNYLFIKMILNRSDSSIEEVYEKGTIKVTYYRDGAVIGMAIKKGEKIVKHWQVLNHPTFGKVKDGMPLDVFLQENS